MYLRKIFLFVLRSAAAFFSFFFLKNDFKKNKEKKKIFGSSYIEFFREVFELEVVPMYSRITNMNGIEDFGTISSETCLKDIPYPKKKISNYSLLFAANKFSTRGGDGEQRERSIFTSAKTQTPISKPLYKPSTVFHFTVHSHTYNLEGDRGGDSAG